MTSRKPPGISFETWIDRQIREGQEQGAFDDLPGQGRPIRGLLEPVDEDWWIRRKLQEEDLAVLPPSLVLCKAVEQGIAEALAAPTEASAREQVEAVNARIRAGNRVAIAGPPVTLVAYDVDEVLARWRTRHPEGDVGPVDPPVLADEVEVPPVRVRWRRWRGRRRLT